MRDTLERLTRKTQLFLKDQTKGLPAVNDDENTNNVTNINFMF